MDFKVGVIAGDGIGPEVTAEAVKVLDAVGKKYGHTFDYTEILMGGCSIDATGVPLTDEAIATAKASDAVLMGSIGGDTSTSPWYKLPPNLRPEAGLLKIRKELGRDDITVIATGGLSKVIIPYCEEEIIYDNELLLKGLRLIYEKNR